MRAVPVFRRIGALLLLVLPCHSGADEDAVTARSHHHHVGHSDGQRHKRRLACKKDSPLANLILLGSKESTTHFFQSGLAQRLTDEDLKRAPNMCVAQYAGREQCCTRDFYEQIGNLHREAQDRFDSIKDVYMFLIEDVLAPVAASLKTTSGGAQAEFVEEAMAYIRGQKETTSVVNSLLQRQARRERRHHHHHAHHRHHHTIQEGTAEKKSVGQLVAHFLDKCELGILGHFAAMTCKVCDPSIASFMNDWYLQVSVESSIELHKSCQASPMLLIQAAAQLKKAHEAMKKVVVSPELGVSDSSVPGLSKAKWWLEAAAQQVDLAASRISFYHDASRFRDRLARSGYAYLPEDWGYVTAMHPSQATIVNPIGQTPSCVNGFPRGSRCICKPCWMGEACDIESFQGPAWPQPFAPLRKDGSVFLRIVVCRMPYDENSQLARIRLVQETMVEDPTAAETGTDHDPCTQHISLTSPHDEEYQVPVFAGERSYLYDMTSVVEESNGPHTVCFCFGAQCWAEPDTWYGLGKVEIVADDSAMRRVSGEIWDGVYPNDLARRTRRCPQEPLMNHDPSVMLTRSWHQLDEFAMVTHFTCSEGFQDMEGPMTLRCTDGVWTEQHPADPSLPSEPWAIKNEGFRPPPPEGKVAKKPPEDVEIVPGMGVNFNLKVPVAAEEDDDVQHLDTDGFVNRAWTGVLPFCYAVRECNESHFPDVKNFKRQLDNGIVTYSCADEAKIVVIPGKFVSMNPNSIPMGERVKVKLEGGGTTVAHVFQDLGETLQVKKPAGVVPKADVEWLTSSSSHQWPCHNHGDIVIECQVPPRAFFEEVTTDAGRLATSIGVEGSPLASAKTATPSTIATVPGSVVELTQLSGNDGSALARGAAAAAASSSLVEQQGQSSSKHHSKGHARHKRTKHHRKHGRHHHAERHEKPNGGGSLLQLGESESEMVGESESAMVEGESEGVAAGLSFLELGSSTEDEAFGATAAAASTAGGQASAPSATSAKPSATAHARTLAGRILVVFPTRAGKEVIQIGKFPVQFTAEPEAFVVDRCWSVNCSAIDDEDLEEAAPDFASAERLALQQELLSSLYELPKLALGSLRICIGLIVWVMLMVLLGPGQVLGCMFCCRVPGGCKPACCLGRADKRRAPVDFGTFAPGGSSSEGPISGIFRRSPATEAESGAWPLMHQKGWVRPRRG